MMARPGARDQLRQLQGVVGSAPPMSAEMQRLIDAALSSAGGVPGVGPVNVATIIKGQGIDAQLAAREAQQAALGSRPHAVPANKPTAAPAAETGWQAQLKWLNQHPTEAAYFWKTHNPDGTPKNFGGPQAPSITQNIGGGDNVGNWQGTPTGGRTGVGNPTGTIDPRIGGQYLPGSVGNILNPPEGPWPLPPWLGNFPGITQSIGGGTDPNTGLPNDPNLYPGNNEPRAALQRLRSLLQNHG